jgi:hypothetical protein
MIHTNELSASSSLLTRMYFDPHRLQLPLCSLTYIDVGFLLDRLEDVGSQFDEPLDDDLFLAIDAILEVLSWLMEDPAIAVSGAARPLAILFREALAVYHGSAPIFFGPEKTAKAPAVVQGVTSPAPRNIEMRTGNILSTSLQALYEGLVRSLVDGSNSLANGGSVLAPCSNGLRALNTFLASPIVEQAISGAAKKHLRTRRRVLDELQQALTESLAGGKTELLHKRVFENSPSSELKARKAINKFTDVFDGLLVNAFVLAKKAFKSRVRAENWLQAEINEAGLMKNGERVSAHSIAILAKKASSQAPIRSRERNSQGRITVPSKPNAGFNKVPTHTFKAWDATRAMLNQPNRASKVGKTIVHDTASVLEPNWAVEQSINVEPIVVDEASLLLWKARILIQTILVFQ